MKNKFLSIFDYTLLLAILILVSLGIMFIYSSSINSEGISVTNEYIKQIIWASLGIVLLVLVSLYDYRKTEKTSIYLYGILIGFLLLVLIPHIGRKVNGARSWLGIGDFGIQPSELGKSFYILFLAKYFSDSENENPLKRFIIAGLIFLVPFGLIMIQPDMGTASVYFPIFIVMAFMAGIPLSYICYILLMAVFTIFFCIAPVWNDEIAKTPLKIMSILTNMKLRFILTAAIVLIGSIGFIVRRYFKGPKYFFWITYFSSVLALGLILAIAAGKVLKPYQIKRLIIFMDPNIDPRGAGWNIIQSKVAIGSGGIFGRGFLNGTQSHYRFLPQQSTDFIFSILSEETGFIGGLIVFGLYLFLLIKMLLLIKRNSNHYGTYIASGIFAMFAFHFFINVGMVMGIMPITGIPLLFLSYGGSSLWNSMICMGIIMNINYRKNDFK